MVAMQKDEGKTIARRCEAMRNAALFLLLALALLASKMTWGQECRTNIAVEVKGTDYYGLPAWDRALTFITSSKAWIRHQARTKADMSR
jgi:hypothetical protein